MGKPRPQKEAETIQSKLGKSILRWRVSRGMSQETLARLSGIDRSYLSRVETGATNVTLSTIESVAQALGMSVVVYLRKSLD